jgi:hypothetical protein
VIVVGTLKAKGVPTKSHLTPRKNIIQNILKILKKGIDKREMF